MDEKETELLTAGVQNDFENIHKEITDIKEQPVSYTHLDVYKRQI